MAELVPYPIGRLISRMFRELEQHDAIFDLPRRKFVTGLPGRDLSVRFHDKPASTPLGPAAGPQSQLAQNIVLSYLGGGRIFELKTVQINDELAIPRPCIDMQTVGYNVEWSQELKLEQSLDEYVKGAMLLEILKASGKVPMAEGFGDWIFDMSVGYDLKGIQTARVRAFIEGMKDCSEVVERLRKQIPDEYRAYRDLEFPTRLSDTLTLSTFHGCPPDEIERMIDWLIREYGLHCIVKLNPTLLGKIEARRIFNDVLGYQEKIPEAAFDKDTQWDQAAGFVERLGKTAEGFGCRFGVKFSNTLIVENHRAFFPKTEKDMYLSGLPLHVLAMRLVGKFRETFGDKYPVSFSAGIDRANFHESAALGLVPVTTCSDLLRPGGYGRMQFYFRDIEKRMEAVGAQSLPDLILLANGLPAAEASLALAHKALGMGDGFSSAWKRGLLVLDARAKKLGIAWTSERLKQALENPPPDCCGGVPATTGLLDAVDGDLHKEWVREAKLANTRLYVDRLLLDARYTNVANSKLPPKVGTKLALFDCITCDKCVPVCPNDANFTYTLPKIQIPIVTMKSAPGGGWERQVSGTLTFDKKHQLANFADFCNECGNCDVFCPEDGGPYILKPRFFGSHDEWAKRKTHDGFFLERANGGQTVHGRFGGRDFRLSIVAGKAAFSGAGFDVSFHAADPEGTFAGTATVPVDLTYFHIMDWLRKSLLEGTDVNYVNA